MMQWPGVRYQASSTRCSFYAFLTSLFMSRLSAYSIFLYFCRASHSNEPCAAKSTPVNAMSFQQTIGGDIISHHCAMHDSSYTPFQALLLGVSMPISTACWQLSPSDHYPATIRRWLLIATRHFQLKAIMLISLGSRT